MTSNMAAIAGRLSYKFHKKCALIQTKRLENDISYPFLENRKESMIREECDYFLAEGMDYLMLQKEIAAEQVLLSLQELIPHQLFYLPPGRRSLSEKSEIWMEKFDAVLHYLEQSVDLIFLDCGTGQNTRIQELMKLADLVVVNFSQSQTALDHFFIQSYEVSKKFFYLIGSYQPESIYNKKNMKRIYRIPTERLGVIPYNPKFQSVCEHGQLLHFMREQNHFLHQDRDRVFWKELDEASNALLEVAAHE